MFVRCRHFSTRNSSVIYARGRGLYGALGLESDLRDHLLFAPLQTNLFADGQDAPKQIETGWGHSLLLTEAGKLYIWGRPHDFTNLLRLNQITKLSRFLARLVAQTTNSSVFGTVNGYFPTPILVEGLEPVQSMTASAGLTMALTESGKVIGFGLNRWGQCGSNDPKQPMHLYSPTAVDKIPLCSKVDAGLQHAIALCSDGRVIGWGKANKGQLGIGKHELTHSVPVFIALKHGAKELQAVDIAAGFAHSTAITEDGALYVWGKGMGGDVIKKMGLIMVAGDQWEPRRIELPNKLKAIQVCSSNFTIVVRADDGSLWVMGMGEHDRNANVLPIPVTSDYKPIYHDDNSTSNKKAIDSVFEGKKSRLKKGYKRVTFHHDSNNDGLIGFHSPIEGQGIVKDFEVILHKGEAYLDAIKLDLDQDYSSSNSSGNERRVSRVVDFSGGWQHDLLIAHTTVSALGTP